jgi:hypothetical protein
VPSFSPATRAQKHAAAAGGGQSEPSSSYGVRTRGRNLEALFRKSIYSSYTKRYDLREVILDRKDYVHLGRQAEIDGYIDSEAAPGEDMGRHAELN